MVSKRLSTPATLLLSRPTERAASAAASRQKAQSQATKTNTSTALVDRAVARVPPAPKAPAEKRHRTQVPAEARPSAMSVSRPVSSRRARMPLASGAAHTSQQHLTTRLRKGALPLIPSVPVFDSPVYVDMETMDMEVDNTLTQDGPAQVSDMLCAMDLDTPPEQLELDLDPTLLTEYQSEIFAYKRHMEIKLLPDPHYMNKQSELKWQYRVHLIEWLVQVHDRFDLLQETIHLCVNYLDRFLSRVIVPIDQLQLAGTAALLLASKFEEIQSPAVAELVYLGGDAYTPAAVRRAEIDMLRALNYDMGAPGPMSFLRRISRADNYDPEIRTLAKYLVDLTLCDHRFIAVPSSMVAAVAYCASMRLLSTGTWTAQHEFFSGYEEATLSGPLNVLLTLLEQPMQSLFAKYQHERYMHASDYVHDLGADVLRSLHI
ncbi:unnamed protein product [Mortierella alpina]